MIHLNSIEYDCDDSVNEVWNDNGKKLGKSYMMPPIDLATGFPFNSYPNQEFNSHQRN